MVSVDLLHVKSVNTLAVEASSVIQTLNIHSLPWCILYSKQVKCTCQDDIHYICFKQFLKWNEPAKKHLLANEAPRLIKITTFHSLYYEKRAFASG